MTAIKLFLLVVSLTAVSFGGGTTLSAGLERELVGTGQITPAQFAAGMALGQSTPGPLAAFTTAMGNYTLGLPGAVAATAGLLAVSLGAVALIYYVPRSLFQRPHVQAAMTAVPPYVAALVFFLAYRVAAGASLSRPVLPVIIVGAVVAGRLRKVPTAYLVLGAVAVGMLTQGTALSGW